MNKNLLDITEPAIPVNIGWQQMQTLLNEYLPSKMQILTRKLQQLSMAAMLLAVMMITSLQFGTADLRSIHSGKIQQVALHTNTTNNKPAALNINNRITNITKLSNNFTTPK